MRMKWQPTEWGKQAKAGEFFIQVHCDGRWYVFKGEYAIWSGRAMTVLQAQANARAWLEDLISAAQKVGAS